jgi:hypothetical protein
LDSLFSGARISFVALIFSTTLSIFALLFARVADSGVLGRWQSPEWGSNGKLWQKLHANFSE